MNFPHLEWVLPIKNGDLPIKNGDLPSKNGDLPIKHGDLPIKNGDLQKWWFPIVYSLKIVIFHSFPIEHGGSSHRN